MIRPVLVASCLVASCACAQTPVDTSRYDPAHQFYVGVNYANFDYNADGLSESVNWDTLGLNLGFQPLSYLAVEGRAGVGIDDDMIGGAVKTELEHYYGIYVLPQFPIEEVVSVYGLFGWTTVEASASASGLKETNSENDLSYGLGVRFLNKHQPRPIGFFAEYARLLDRDDAEVDTLTVGLTWHF